MILYKCFTTRGNVTRYSVKKTARGQKTKYGFISPADVPEIVMAEFKAGKTEVDASDMDLNAIPKLCIFDDLPSKLSRLVNGQIVYLCEDHYYAKSLGQVAQHIREVHNEEEVTV